MSGFAPGWAWFDVIADVRTRRFSFRGVPMNFLLVRAKDWEFNDSAYPPGIYGSVIRALRLYLVEDGYQKPNRTLHSARNAISTFAAQLGRVWADRATVSTWAPRSQTPTDYGRQKCVSELRL